MKVGYRQLVPGDEAAMVRLERAVFPEDPWTEGQYREELAFPVAFYVGAFVDGELVGAGGVKGIADVDLMTVGVLPDHRGRGIGRQIMEILLAFCRETEVQRLFLEVRESNEAAIRLYHHLGFEDIGRISDYYRHPAEDAVTMRLLLTGE